MNSVSRQETPGFISLLLSVFLLPPVTSLFLSVFSLFVNLAFSSIIIQLHSLSGSSLLLQSHANSTQPDPYLCVELLPHEPETPRELDTAGKVLMRLRLKYVHMQMLHVVESEVFYVWNRKEKLLWRKYIFLHLKRIFIFCHTNTLAMVPIEMAI